MVVNICFQGSSDSIIFTVVRTGWIVSTAGGLPKVVEVQIKNKMRKRNK